ncbi:patatin-like phospholipase family protein [Hydrogenophaga sp. PAMC20947]|uniref:patatin-like phospholipase family protein n=1 Tax=Hydrogenophaga sp. PAMC20947 TaxID=2565558 RepID=UPI001FF7E82E|nr:patatin-like phospholipase family protein [Hydrogenophaga sp. PAMC20947]
MVMQGGGAVGAFHLGVYQALHEGSREPDWVIGTSIGAINAALIAGNPPQLRLPRLRTFWERIQPRQAAHSAFSLWPSMAALAQTQHNLGVVVQGVPGFFAPHWPAWFNPRQSLGIEKAAYYDTQPLRDTLNELVDFDYLARSPTRITVGAVNARTGQMRYFDSRHERLSADHILASGALAPAFGAVRIDGDPYWDGGLYSNTPIEVVLDDKPRCDSLIFACRLWEPHGDEPQSLSDVQSRLKDIQFASRAESHIERQKQLHRLRHIIRDLAQQVPDSEHARELGAWGCNTMMHVVALMAPHLAGDDQTKDIDFTPRGINLRSNAGLQLGRRALAEKPWQNPHDPLDGLCLHKVHLEPADSAPDTYRA